MAKSTKAVKLAMRSALSDAYSYVLANELNYGLEAINFDVLIQMELARLEDGEVTGRGSMKAQIAAMKKRVDDALEAIKKIDPADFDTMGEEEKVNTDPSGEEPIQ